MWRGLEAGPNVGRIEQLQATVRFTSSVTSYDGRTVCEAC